ncbi:hypothetical protein Bca52824_017185 [Brassica carinata]|uniref:Uncharacterized protein n=1 Tax=Brassica carinata TaxID=52824 RepID=A0A8X8AX55_BRACI|nr:hypothetical protein Bca52824_017185 [Brassica carinata]
MVVVVVSQCLLVTLPSLHGLHYPVVYKSLFGCVYGPSINSCFDLLTTPPYKVIHGHLSSLFSTYFATVEWFRHIFVWVMLELRFMILAGDIPMGLVSFASTFATSSSIYIALAMRSLMYSSLMGSIRMLVLYSCISLLDGM